MKVEKSDVLAFTITDVERLDPVRVMIENYEPGKGRITITCFGKAWTGAWFAIPEPRRTAVPGCQTCAECQGVIELRNKQRGHQ